MPALTILGMHHSLDVLTALTQDILDAGDCETRLQLVTDFALRLSPAANQASVSLSSSNELQPPPRPSGTTTGCPSGARRGRRPRSWIARKTIVPLDRERGDATTRVGSLVSVPIRARGATLGTLSLSAETSNAFGDEDEALARLLAQAAAQALITSELEQRAITDAQTLAFNRGHLFPRLQLEMELARSQRAPLSILLMDIDHFKRVNDVHGHPVGDALLRCFADTVRALVRSTDVLIRRGGEEFVVITPNTRECFAYAVAERLRRKVAASPFVLCSDIEIMTTISIGVTTWDGQESGEALDARADRFMYEAKQRGRNQTVCRSEPRPTLQLCSNHGQIPIGSFREATTS